MEASGSPALRFRGVRREYGGVVAVDGLDMRVAAGTCVVLVGRNGSGKTTTLQLAAGRLEPTLGIVEVDGRSTSTPDGRQHVRHSVTFALDAPVFYPDLTVEEHLALVATAHGVADADGRMEALLGDFDLGGRRQFLPDQLSSGMRQKLQLACLLLRPGHVLLLDEPGRALDPRTREVLWSSLGDRKAAGDALVFSTHQLDFPPELVDQVVVLRDGVVQDSGEYDTVMAGDAVAELGLV